MKPFGALVGRTWLFLGHEPLDQPDGSSDSKLYSYAELRLSLCKLFLSNLVLLCQCANSAAKKGCMKTKFDCIMGSQAKNSWNKVFSTSFIIMLDVAVYSEGFCMWYSFFRSWLALNKPFLYVQVLWYVWVPMKINHGQMIGTRANKAAIVKFIPLQASTWRPTSSLWARSSSEVCKSYSSTRTRCTRCWGPSLTRWSPRRIFPSGLRSTRQPPSSTTPATATPQGS